MLEWWLRKWWWYAEGWVGCRTKMAVEECKVGWSEVKLAAGGRKPAFHDGVQAIDPRGCFAQLRAPELRVAHRHCPLLFALTVRDVFEVERAQLPLKAQLPL